MWSYDEDPDAGRPRPLAMSAINWGEVVATVIAVLTVGLSYARNPRLYLRHQTKNPQSELH
ncbi:MAG: hypothetical protein P4N24_08520 [Acidobacteriota bacterium]|nr:hypothetical protein [Acidobacteriota bacterium]